MKLSFNHILVISSILFFAIPYSVYKTRELPLDLNQTIFMCSFFLQALVSILFWSNPLDGSLIHKIDGRLAKTLGIFAIIYVLYWKKLEVVEFAFGMFGVIVFAVLSHISSSKSWCSINHVIYHLFFHFISSLMLGFTIFQ
jgi:hypothetical protein